MSNQGEKNNNIHSFIRVASDYFKIIECQSHNGNVYKELIPWNLRVLKEDFPEREVRKQIRCYDKFIVEPSHLEYKQEINGNCNLYSALSHQPKKGKWDNIKKMLHHVFAEHYEYGLDYIQLLYMKPKQLLPILVLVSKERNTGKTTFANFINDLFQSNVTFNTNENFRSPFNSDWAAKLVIIIDEALLNSRSDCELIKNKSTASKIKIELKGVNRREIDFYGKFILCSNDEKNPIYIQKAETRFWVRKINVLTLDDCHIREKMYKEIPAFLYYLKHRELYVKEQQSRMWFNPDDLKTEALLKVIQNSVNVREQELIEFIQDVMMRHNLESYTFSVADLIGLMKKENIKLESSIIKRILHSWDLESRNSSYTTIVIDPKTEKEVISTTRKGRFYTVSNKKLLTI